VGSRLFCVKNDAYHPTAVGVIKPNSKPQSTHLQRKTTMKGWTFIHNGNGYCRPDREEVEELLADLIEKDKFFKRESKFSYCAPDGSPIQYAQVTVEEGHLISYKAIKPPTSRTQP
jgi:hypothetical protein